MFLFLKFMPLDPPPDPDQPYLYAARPIHTPQDDFYIYVHGVTEDGYSFMRATKNAILNIRPGERPAGHKIIRECCKKI